MKDFNYYNQVDVEYPSTPKKPYLKKNATAAEHRDYADYLETYEREMIIYKEKKRIYEVARKEKDDEFWKDAFEEIGISQSHPKAEKLRSLAYERGHSSGYSDIYNELSDLAELIN